MIIFHAYCSLAFARDIALATGVIYNRNMFMLQATAEIVSIDHNLRS